MSATVNPENCKVALLAGGMSEEREVSLKSGQGAKKALEAAGFPVMVFDPASKEDLKALIDGPFDVAFLCVHGKYGEDGSLQGLLDIIGVPYTGSSVWASALAMDKNKAKLFYDLAGIKTPKAITLSCPEDRTVEEIAAEVGERAVVKPATEGSSVGLFLVRNQKELAEAIGKACKLDKEILVETYIKGNEYTVAVIGNEDPQALPPIQIIPMNEFYDFESKYAPGGSEHLCPAPLDERLTEKLMSLGVAAHKVLGCSGVSRSDFILDEHGDFWILETNTLPGMTETSLLPDAGRAAGIEFPELCRKLVGFALEKR